MKNHIKQYLKKPLQFSCVGILACAAYLGECVIEAITFLGNSAQHMSRRSKNVAKKQTKKIANQASGATFY